MESDKVDNSTVEMIGVIQKMIAMQFSVVMCHGRSALEWKSLLPPVHQDTGRVLSIVNTFHS